MRVAQAARAAKALKRELQSIEKQIEQLARPHRRDGQCVGDRAPMRSAVASWSDEKICWREKAWHGRQAARTLEESFELAFAFLSNPWKLWDSDRLEH